MLVHDGPLLETRISHVPAGRLKCDTQALFRLANAISSCWIGLYVCLLSSSNESFCTTISWRADPFIFLRLFMASFLVLFPMHPESGCNVISCSHVSCASERGAWLTNEVDQTFVHKIQYKFSFFSKTHFVTYVILILSYFNTLTWHNYFYKVDFQEGRIFRITYLTRIKE